MQLNPSLLARCMACNTKTAELWLPWIDAATVEYEIAASKLRLAMFLAQTGHETMGLYFISEVWGNPPTREQAKYEGRADLGNTQPGDGVRFRGRGLIQNTGRANYISARDRMRVRLGSRVPDFEATPELMLLPQWAAMAAGDYWQAHGLNALSDAGNVDAVTRRINGGLTGIKDRQLRYDRCMLVL